MKLRRQGEKPDDEMEGGQQEAEESKQRSSTEAAPEKPKKSDGAGHQNARKESVGAVAKEEQPVYCICRKADEMNMIQCDGCSEWFHFECMGIKGD
mmetsp:Transcript_14848/g.25272  ORF Transcript_14848/g.25272 Transcript_14848/m.25272 type:complete len:96 (-) Transcript_14848:199-486(-)